MDGYYYNYLFNSDCYTKINSAIEGVNEQKNNVMTLKTVFDTASGNNIENIKNDLTKILNDLDKYLNTLENIKTQLVDNANSFDEALNIWKSRIGENYVKPIENQLISFANDVYVYLNSTEKITDAFVGENGYVNVKTKEEIYHITYDKQNETKTKKIISSEDHAYEEPFGEEARSGWWG